MVLWPASRLLHLLSMTALLIPGGRGDPRKHEQARAGCCRRGVSDSGTIAERRSGGQPRAPFLREERAALGVALEEGELGSADFVDVGLGESFYPVERGLQQPVVVVEFL